MKQYFLIKKFITWHGTPPNGTTKNHVDHFCISRKLYSLLADVYGFTGTGVGNYHNLGIAKLKIKLKGKKKVKRRPHINSAQFEDRNTKSAFQLEMKNRVSGSPGLNIRKPRHWYFVEKHQKVVSRKRKDHSNNNKI